jgi:hypothetical protein
MRTARRGFYLAFVRFGGTYSYVTGRRGDNLVGTYMKGAEVLKTYELDEPPGVMLSRPLGDFVHGLQGKQPAEIEWPVKLTDLCE